MAATPEAKVKAKIKDWLSKIGAWYCMPVGTGFGVSGVPDFVCCFRGLFFAIEAKAPGRSGTTTALQKLQIELISEAGGLVYVVDSPAKLDQIEDDLYAKIFPQQTGLPKGV